MYHWRMLFFASVYFFLHTLLSLLQVYRNEKAQFYVTYMPFEDYGAEMRSQHTFVDYKAAQKDAKKLHYFRAKLVTNCQTEFQQSTMNVSIL